MENAKVYVDVLVNFDKDGTMSPVDFIWEDGIIPDFLHERPGF